VSDIDSERMVIHIHQGKGSRDRDVPMTPKLLEAVRQYWQWKRPKVYLFPSTSGHRGFEQPISDKTVWYACKESAGRAGIKKRIGGCLTVLGVQWKLAIPKAEFRSPAVTARRRVVDSRHLLSSTRLAINVERQFFGNCPQNG
jgi:hypothetical protein